MMHMRKRRVDRCAVTSKIGMDETPGFPLIRI